LNDRINIIYAEDNSLDRNGIIRQLSDFPELNFEHSVSNGKELLAWLESKFNHKNYLPDVVLLDINMSIMNGSQAYDEIRSAYPGLKVIVLSEHYTDRYIVEFMTKGARAFLNKNAKPETIAETVRRVHKYGKCIDPFVANIMRKKGLLQPMSELPAEEREDLGLNVNHIRIIRCMLDGMTTKEISDKLDLGYKNVERLRGEVWDLTNCKKGHFLDLAEFAFRNGIISF
jgi:DNA-binding NarL/FixJ family response regulator